MVASKVGVIPETAFPNASFRETLIVMAETPFATTGPALAIVDVVLTGPARNVTDELVETFGIATLIDLTSARVDFSEQVDVPVASVAEHAEIKLFDPLTVYVGTTPTMGVAPSKTVIVMVEASTLSAM